MRSDTRSSSGSRFCGMVDEPTWPGIAGSATSATSVLCSRTTSAAMRSPVEPTSSSAYATPRSGARAACQGPSGTARPRRSQYAASTPWASGPSDASVPAAPASWPGSEAPAPRRARAPTAARRPTTPPSHRTVIGTACWPCVRPGIGRAVVPLRERGDCHQPAHEVAVQQGERVPQLQDEPGIDDVLRRGAPVRPRARVPRLEHERADQRHQRVLRVGDAVAQGIEVVTIGLAGLGDRSRGLDRGSPRSRPGRGRARLGIEPALHELRRIEDRPHRRRAEEVAQQRVVERRRHQSAPPSSAARCRPRS